MPRPWERRPLLRRHAPLLAALLLSLLLHLSLFAPRWTLAPAPPAPPPILQARLEKLASAKPPPAAPRPTSRTTKIKPSAPKKKAPVHATKPEPAATAPATSPLPQPEVKPAQTSAPPEDAKMQPPAPPLNAVPARLQIVYRIRYGPLSGQQVLEWAVDKEHYTLSTVVRATGLAGLFYRGRIVQISRGVIGPQGLVPHEFWDERGDYFAQARFDYAAGEVVLQSNRGIRHYPIAAQIQDALSLLLQIALTAPPPERAQVELFNSKKVRHYLIRTLGEETLEIPLGRVTTLHLAKGNDKPGEETFDVWLAPAYHYLPVKIVRGDPHGLDVSLVAESISASGASPVPQAGPESAAPIMPPAASATRPSDTAR